MTKFEKMIEADADVQHVCGIVMPISAIDGCDEGHWGEVLGIVSEAIEAVGFKPNIVSNADDVGIIQKRIIQNLYENPIVVCDVSGKNPNVMFELGIRLAFDKPTIIIKDDKTSYSFDTSQIEHLDYPRDLRFSKIVEFKASLQAKLVATYAASKSPDFTTFLKHFGEFKVAKIEEKEVSQSELLSEELADIKMTLNRLLRDSRYYQKGYMPGGRRFSSASTEICMDGFSDKDISAFFERAGHHAGVSDISFRPVGKHTHLVCDKRSDWPQPIEDIRADLMKELKAITGRNAKNHISD